MKILNESAYRAFFRALLVFVVFAVRVQGVPAIVSIVVLALDVEYFSDACPCRSFLDPVRATKKNETWKNGKEIVLLVNVHRSMKREKKKSKKSDRIEREKTPCIRVTKSNKIQ